MKIYLFTHMDADDDRRKSYGGMANDELTDVGRNYAKEVGKFLKEKDIEVIYTSPYSRAKETAEIINKVLNVDIVEIYNLRERNSYGVLSGIEKERAIQLFPSVAERVEQMDRAGYNPTSTTETLLGAETYIELLLRAKDAFNQIFRENKLKGFKNVVVVTHGGFSWAFLRDIISNNITHPNGIQKGEIVVLKGDDLKGLEIIDFKRLNKSEKNYESKENKGAY